MNNSRTEWANPYPKWTKAEGQWSRLWLVVLLVFVVVSLLYTFGRAALVDPEMARFRHFPDVEAIMPLAVAAAVDEKPDARLASIHITSREPMYEETLEYRAEFYFCSPTDFTWALQLGAVRRFRLLGRNVDLVRLTDSPDSKIPTHMVFSCERYSLDSLNDDASSVAETMWSALSEDERTGLEKRPRWMKLARDERGALRWHAIFKCWHSDYGRQILFDAERRTIESVGSVERLVFSDTWVYGRH